MSATVDRYGNRYTVVRARKRHRCPNYHVGTGTPWIIEAGDLYLRHVAFPGDVVDRLTVLPECLPCARKAGRPGLPAGEGDPS